MLPRPLEIKSKLLSKLASSCSWVSFFMLVLQVVFPARSICLSFGIPRSLNTYFASLEMYFLDSSRIKTQLASFMCYGSYLGGGVVNQTHRLTFGLTGSHV